MPRKKKEISVTKKTKFEDKKEVKNDIKQKSKILMTDEQKKEWLKSFSDIEKAIDNLYKGCKNEVSKTKSKRNKTTK